MWKADRLCVFYHRIKGRSGCTRADCVFVHDIQDRLNTLLDNADGMTSLENITNLLSIVDSGLLKAEKVSKLEASGNAATVTDGAVPEKASDITLRRASESVRGVDACDSGEMTARALVVQAVAATEDRICPSLLESIAEELECSFSESTSPEVSTVFPGAGYFEHKDATIFIQHMALEAFEKRRLAEEQLDEDGRVPPSSHVLVEP